MPTSLCPACGQRHTLSMPTLHRLDGRMAQAGLPARYPMHPGPAPRRTRPSEEAFPAALAASSTPSLAPTRLYFCLHPTVSTMWHVLLPQHLDRKVRLGCQKVSCLSGTLKSQYTASLMSSGCSHPARSVGKPGHRACWVSGLGPGPPCGDCSGQLMLMKGVPWAHPWYNSSLPPQSHAVTVAPLSIGPSSSLCPPCWCPQCDLSTEPRSVQQVPCSLASASLKASSDPVCEPSQAVPHMLSPLCAALS